METPHASHAYNSYPPHENLTILETETSASEYASHSERNSDGGASTAYLPANVYGNSPAATHDGQNDHDAFYYDGDDGRLHHGDQLSFTYDETHIPKEDPLGHSTAMARRPSTIHGLARDRTALWTNYAAVGATHALLQTLVYPFLKSYLNMEEYRAYSGELLVALPWSFKLWIALFSDCFPIRGQRRKPLLYGGWALCGLIALVIACIPSETPYLKDHKVANDDAAKSGAKYMALFFFVSLGLVIADVACDAIVVELSQREPESHRGTTLLTALMARYSGHAAVTFLTALLCNSEAYGGSFAWGAAPNAMLSFVVVAAAIALAATRIYMVEDVRPQHRRATAYRHHASRASTTLGEPEQIPKDTNGSEEPPSQRWATARMQCRALWKFMQRRVTLQTLVFVFFARVCFSYYASNTKVVYETWLSVSPLLSNIFTAVNSLIYVAVAFLLKRSHLLTSWKRVIQGAVVISVVMTAIPMVFIVTNAVRNSVLTLLVDQLVAFVEIAASIVILLVILEVTDPHGLEATSFALFTSIANAAIPLASSLSQSIGSHFDAYDSDWVKDIGAVRWKVVGAFLVWVVFRALTFALLPLLPEQKREMAMFKEAGGNHRLAAMYVTAAAAFVLLWEVFTTLLAAVEATACLTVAGGEGC